MADRTYIKLFRKILTWGWYGDTNTFRVFMHILLNANYKPSELRGYTIGRGECVMGYRAWAKELGLSVQQVRTAIEHLKSTHEVTLTPTRYFTIVKVEKWDFWQVEDGKVTRTPTQELTSKQHRSNTEVTQSKESKNIRNKEIIINGHKKGIRDPLPGFTLEEKLAAWRNEK